VEQLQDEAGEEQLEETTEKEQLQEVESISTRTTSASRMRTKRLK